MTDLSNETIIHQKKNGIEFLQFRKLLQYKELVHCYTLKINNFDIAGNDTYKQKEKLLYLNFKKIAKALTIDVETILIPYQTHTNIVKKVDKKEKGISIFPKELENVDGLITNKKNITFSLGFADCTPIYLYDPIKKVIRKYTFWLERNITKNWKSSSKKNDRRI